VDGSELELWWRKDIFSSALTQIAPVADQLPIKQVPGSLPGDGVGRAGVR
jgi:hypothetical protein